jgi:predicted NAD/FAD-dependent oxidoreductase
MFVESTYEAIFAEIARLPCEKATIRLNERVTTVKTTGRDVENSQVVLETEKGESLAFDEVLMTTPLGWLKRNKDTVFQPSLPERLSAGIDEISVGHLEKVFPPRILVFALFNH